MSDVNIPYIEYLSQNEAKTNKNFVLYIYCKDKSKLDIFVGEFEI